MQATRSKRLLAGLVFAISSTLAVQAAVTGSIALSGSEPAILELTVTAETAASNLPLNTTVSDLKVGTVVERSNKKAGYTVTLQSANALAAGSVTPSLRSPTNSDFLPYTIKYGGLAVTFPAGGGAAIVSSFASRTVAAGTPNTVTVSFDGANAFLNEAVYTDTLTFSIIAK